jgi:hypothetical protein
MITELIAGRFDFFHGPVGIVLPHIREGQLLALAVNSPKRAECADGIRSWCLLMRSIPTGSECSSPQKRRATSSTSSTRDGQGPAGAEPTEQARDAWD